MKLRNTWARTFRLALDVLKKWNTDVSNMTIALIQSNKIEFRPFSRTTLEDYDGLLMEDLYSSKKQNRHGGKTLTKKIKEAYEGFIYENRVYVNEKITEPDAFAKVLVHELNHFINDSNDKYETKAQKFQEELRAHLAESMASGRYITRALLKQTAEEVADCLEMKCPDNLTMPGGAYYKKV